MDKLLLRVILVVVRHGKPGLIECIKLYVVQVIVSGNQVLKGSRE